MYKYFDKQLYRALQVPHMTKYDVRILLQNKNKFISCSILSVIDPFKLINTINWSPYTQYT